jgi:hypothetical protein
MTIYATFKLELEVHFLDALYDAALEHAIHVDGMSFEHATESLRRDGVIDAAACLGMLLDPGSLPGCDIDHHAVEISAEDEEE